MTFRTQLCSIRATALSSVREIRVAFSHGWQSRSTDGKERGLAAESWPDCGGKWRAEDHEADDNGSDRQHEDCSGRAVFGSPREIVMFGGDEIDHALNRGVRGFGGEDGSDGQHEDRPIGSRDSQTTSNNDHGQCDADMNLGIATATNDRDQAGESTFKAVPQRARFHVS